MDALLAVVLAPSCCACRQPLLHPTRGCICPDCWNAVVPVTPPLCDCCGNHLGTISAPLEHARCLACQITVPVVDRSRAAGSHTGALRAILHALKYDGRRSVAAPLAQLMRRTGAELIDACDVAVPVPLHGGTSARLSCTHCGGRATPIRRPRCRLPRVTQTWQARLPSRVVRLRSPEPRCFWSMTCEPPGPRWKRAPRR
jgi:Double zinc ribbon domain